ncbi:MAG: iron ABC transporter permease [Halomonas sp.]|uniref:Iron ABC transporter permease n=1 Tax=Halomonas sulfidivorans TaxID=2733488 RepID=A0ABX7WEW3_9GAMM|nr:iron ABC transporter permease [Halomonas sulfidivorans]MDX5378316.1 iron ABC transporter permease [Halomonas sp.]MDX5503581.1 iron ABC transporter permease [Halomonas sp.]QTP58729.1 iron ABC transporter permease [Halomonas sulfidivorans]
MSRSVVLRVANGRLSLRLEHRTLAVTLLLSLALAASAMISLSLGSQATPPTAVLEALFHPARSDIALIVHEIRLPRIVLAILVGACLGVAGLLLQGLVRNPLASPDVIGITGGASLAAVCFLALGGAALGEAWLPLAALAGALSVALLILALSGRGVTPARLVLIGIGLAAALGAGTTLVLVLAADTTAMQAYVWLTGSLYAAQWREVAGLAPWALVGLPLALALSRRLDVLALGDELATGLGTAVRGTRLALLLLAVALAGSAVAFAGGLSFVGLLAPHIGRRLVARGHAGLVPATALIGALIVLHADLLGRIAFLPRDLPAGVFVAGIGAPFFVYLLHRWRT